VSLNDPDGRAVGPYLAKKLEESLKGGRAVKKNLISEISDCELMIPRIGPDTISDMHQYIMVYLYVAVYLRNLIRIVVYLCQNNR